MLKTRSVDATASPQAVLQSEMKNMQGLDLLQVMDLLPFHKDHFAMQAKKA
jgi:fibrillarin-like rRNA methylase